MRSLIIDPKKCTGCGVCPAICPEVFEMDADSKAKVKNSWKKADEELIKQAADACPAEAIVLA